MYLNVGGVAKGYIFEKMSLVASQLPLTREPRKRCGARVNGGLAMVVGMARVGVMYGKESGISLVIAKREYNPLSHGTEK